MTPTGSEILPPREAFGPTFRRGAIARSRSASVRTSIGPATWSNGMPSARDTAPALFRLEAGFLHHSLPAREVFLHVGRQPRGRAADRIHPLPSELGANVRLAQDAIDLDAELGHDRRRRTCRREDSIPGLDL